MSNGEVCGSIVKMQHIRWILLQLAGKSPFDRTINPIHPSVVNRLNIQTSAYSIENLTGFPSLRPTVYSLCARRE